MANKIQIKRGLKSKLPVLSDGEFGLCTDTKEVFVGNGGENIDVTKSSQLAESKKIVESGSNANGNYIKFTDGTMICYTQGPSLTTSEKFGVGYKSPPWTWTFPASYTSVPKVLAMGANYTMVSGGGTNYYSCIFTLFSLDSAGRVGNAYVFAIGTWK